MSAPHFFVDPKEVTTISPGDHLSLSVDDSHHALRSLRLRVGEEVSVSNNAGWVGLGRLASEKGGRAVIEVLDARRHEEVLPRVTVALAPPKGDRLAWAVQKLAEVGTDEVVLIETRRGIRFPSGAALKRLEMVAREAAMQARQPWITAVHAGEPAQLLFHPGDESAVDVVLSPSAEAGLSSVLPQARPMAVQIMVGPEGGFTEDEVRTARAHGAAEGSLGPGLLRTETAAVVGAALVLARYGRLG